MAHAGPSKRRQVIVEEDATKLQFGDFADGEALTITDVQTLLQAARNVAGAPKAPDNKVYKLTTEYISHFANAPGEVIESMRAALAAHPQFLNKFETAQIMYLRPESVEVAVALIPSLDRHLGQDDSTALLQQILSDIRDIARYGARP